MFRGGIRIYNKKRSTLMKFIDLSAQEARARKAVLKAAARVVARGSFILGKEGRALEEKIAALTGTAHAAGLNSGTDALFLSLKARSIGKGDEVITTPFSFFATAEVIANAGAKPVFVDIEPETFLIDPSKIERAITRRTKAILPVHLYGQMADMVAVNRIARTHKLFVVEDAAQALGASQLHGKRSVRAGAAGDVACFSFFPTKNLGAAGDAGMITTNRTALAERMRLLRNHGSAHKYRHVMLGYSSRLDELQAAILLAKLPYLARSNRARQKLAARYTAAFAGVAGITTPFVAPGNTHIFHQYTLRAAARDGLRAFLEKRGIPTIVHYPLPLHLQPAFAYLKHKKGDLPEAERAAREALSLPLYPGLEKPEQDRVIRAVRSFFSA